MKIKYTCKKLITLDLKKFRVFCKIYTERDRQYFIEKADFWGYTPMNGALGKLPLALFIGGTKGDMKIDYGEVDFDYFELGSNYQLVKIEEFRNAIMKK